jgi:hypothetical protein
VRVAVVHDWLVVEGGAERVLREILALFPDADLFSVVDFVPEGHREFLGGRTPRTTFAQHLPFARRHYRKYLALMPLAIEQLDFSGYDLVISSSYAVAKGIITGPAQVHVCYLHSAARYAWDLQATYLREARLERGLLSWLARWQLHKFRIWDVRTANGVDHLLTNSQFVAGRARKIYGREAVVVHPPVDVEAFALGTQHEDFYLTTSRLVPYKRIPLIVEAFAGMPDRRLVVIGDGPEMPAVRAAAGPNVTVLGYQERAVVVDYMRRARAFVFAAEEDFGITPLEAQAAGTPVIAFGRGGALETIVADPPGSRTGVFFGEQSVASIQAAVAEFEQLSPAISPAACRENALRFSGERFRRAFMDEVAFALSGGDRPASQLPAQRVGRR